MKIKSAKNVRAKVLSVTHVCIYSKQKSFCDCATHAKSHSVTHVYTAYCMTY